VNKNKIIRIVFVIVGLFLVLHMFGAFKQTETNKNLANSDYTKFVTEVTEGKINKVTIVERLGGPRLVHVEPKAGEKFTLTAPYDNTLIDNLRKNKVVIHTEEEEGPSTFERFLSSWGPILLFIGVWIFFMKKMSGGGKGLFQFNKSKAKLVNPDDIKVTFKDVVGCDEAKAEAEEFVDFLKNPEKFSKLGGRTPRGVLLTGPAGTGKTLLARALAKESGVPFLSLSGSEFVEMFVGVGASRVRDLFETAKKHAPCVIFIDEIDAIGGARGNGMGGGHDEKEQTLNQILVELDGFDTNKGVILVAATNRPEILDKALLRPGRIDRQIVVGLPDVYGREEILKIHSKEVPLANNVDLAKIARGTPGFSGAELANLINEATIFAARRSKKFIEHSELEDAKDKIMMGVERPSLAMSVADKRDTAYHESGHAVVAKLLKNADPVHKVTIIPRGPALGLTLQLPEEDRWSYKVEYLKDKITILMAGRAAEEIFCNTRTNGASNDISVATNIARSMVTEWGMSDLGPIAFGNREGNNYINNGQLNTSGLSQSTLEKVELVIHGLLNEEYLHAKTLLEENKDIVEAMTAALMKVETIDDWQIENLMQRRDYDDQAGLATFTENAKVREAQIAAGRKVSIVKPLNEGANKVTHTTDGTFSPDTIDLKKV
jgi:cell division protease FtsH